MSTGSTGSTVDPEVVRWVRRVLPVGSLPLPEPDAGALVDVATVRRFAGGTVMVAGGRPPHEVYLAERLVLAQRHQTDVLGGCLESRIAALLLRHPEDVLELSQETVARLVAVRRSSANQALQRMAARGDIRVAYRRIEVLDRPALRRLRDQG